MLYFLPQIACRVQILNSFEASHSVTDGKTLHAGSSYSVGLVHLDGHLADSVRRLGDHFQETGSTERLGVYRSGQLKIKVY